MPRSPTSPCPARSSPSADQDVVEFLAVGEGLDPAELVLQPGALHDLRVLGADRRLRLGAGVGLVEQGQGPLDAGREHDRPQHVGGHVGEVGHSATHSTAWNDPSVRR